MTKEITTQVDPLIPVPQVCAEFNISRTTYWRWERDGVLPRSHKINGRKHQPRSVLDKLRERAATAEGAGTMLNSAPRNKLLSDDELPLIAIEELSREEPAWEDMLSGDQEAWIDSWISGYRYALSVQSAELDVDHD